MGSQPAKLLSNEALDRSAVVANRWMNRERRLVGSNGYDAELGFNPLEFLRQRLATQQQCAWLDLCCGSGRALLDAARSLHGDGLSSRVRLVGVDLAGLCVRIDRGLNCLRFVKESLDRWDPQEAFDLITCVHGLHYIGDKLRLLARAATWIVDDGYLVANLDSSNLRLSGRQAGGRSIIAALQDAGFEYDHRRRLIRCDGRKSVDLPYQYLGADDQAGPNYAGQPAVDAYYEPTR